MSRQKDWGQVVLHFQKELHVDVAAEYERLKEISRIPADKLTDPHVISSHLNSASKNAHVAFLMYLRARREASLFEIEYKREMRELTRLAMARITAWMKNAELVRKQITESMIQEEIAAALDTRERFEALSKRKQDLQDLQDAMKNFAELWSDRRSSLQSQSALAKQKREVVLDPRRG